MTTHTYGKDEDLPILKSNAGDDDLGGLPVFKSSAPVKKKESSLPKIGDLLGLSSKNVLKDGESEPKSITLTPEQEAEFNQRMGKIKPEQEHDDDFIKDPVKNITLPYRNKLSEVNTAYKQSGLKQRLVSESTNLTGIGNAGSLKEQHERELQDSFHKLTNVTNEVVKTLLPNGKKAIEYIQHQVKKNKGEIPEGNETFNIAAAKAVQYSYLKDRLDKGKSITQVAVDMEREVDKNFDDQVSVLEQDRNAGKRTGSSGLGTDIYENVIPGMTQGKLIDVLIHQPDIDVIASESPKVKSEVDFLRNGGLYQRYPEYGKYVMANELSRERQKLGKNNFLINVVGEDSKFMDNMAEEMYKNEPWKLKFYNENFKGQLKGKIATDDIATQATIGAAETFDQMAASLKDVSGFGESTAERIYTQLDKESGHVGTGAEGWRKWVGQASRFAGMIGAMAAPGGVLKATKLSPAAINTIVAADTFYDTELNNWTMKYPAEPLKAQMGAILTTAAFSAGGKVFPSSQIADDIARKMTPEIKTAVANLSEGVVSKEAKKSMLAKYAGILKETLKGTGEATGVIVGVNAFENAFDQIAGDHDIIKKYHPENRVLEEAKGMVIGSLFPQFRVAIGKRNAVGNSLMDIAERPDVFKQTITEMFESGKMDKSEFDKKIEDITFLNQVRETLDNLNIKESNKKRMLVEALNEKHIKERNATLPESAISRKAQKDLDRSSVIQERILNGEDVVKEEELADMPKEDVSILDRAKEVAGKGLKITLDTDHPEAEKVKFLKEQSIDTPNALKDQLGGNEELVTDIIATNSKAEIEGRIKFYEEELKNPDYNEVDFENMDKHLTLLEKGLEKAGQKPQPKINEATADIKAVEGNVESNEPTKASETAEVPPPIAEGGEAPPEITTEKEPVISGGEDLTGITHAQMDATSRELGLEEYETKPETIAEWDAEAGERLKKPGSIGKVLDKMEKGRRIEPVENRMLIRYVASLKARINASPTPELIKEFDRVKGLSNIAGRLAAKELVSRKGQEPVADTLADYLLIRQKDKKRELTETQIKEEAKKFEDKQQAEKDYEASLSIDEGKAAEKEFEKLQKKKEKSLKKTSADYRAEREQLKKELKEAKEKHEQWLKDQGIHKAGFGVTITGDMAKAVGKIIKSHINEGVDKLHDLIDRVYDDVKDIFEGVTKEDVREFIVYGDKSKPKVVLSKETLERKDRLIKINKDIEQSRQNDQYENLGGWQKKWEQAQNILGIRRLVQTSLDASILLRQLGSLAFNPRKWPQFLKAATATVKILKSAKNYDRIMFDMKNEPDFAESVKDGIRYNEPESLNSEQRNELYSLSRKSFVYRLPLIKYIAGIPLSRSQKLADGTLNVARYELYQKHKKALLADKITRESDPEAYKEMAKLVMNTTGSGNLLGMFENAKAQKVLGSVFYGARLMAANFNSLNPVYYAKITKKNKRLGYEAMRDLASYTATIMSTGAGLWAAGGKISMNPDDSDFLQIRFGDKVYDISGGKAAYVRTFLRWVEAGHARVFKTKHEAAESMKFATESTQRFFRNKLSPNTSYAYTWTFGMGKNSIGQDADPWEPLKIMPMYVDDAWKAAKEDGILSLLTVIAPNLLGIGYGNYYSEPSEQPLDDLIERNTRTDEQDKSLIKNYNDGGREITNKEFENYIDKRDDEIERRLTILFNKGAYVIENGKTVLKPFDKLSKEEIIKETSVIKQAATAKIKEDLFGKKKETGRDKAQHEKQQRQRKKLYD